MDLQTLYDKIFEEYKNLEKKHLDGEISLEEGEKELESLFGKDFSEIDNMLHELGKTQKLFYKKESEDIPNPEYNYELDSGFDLYANEEVVIDPLGRKLVSTGLVFQIPDGYELQIRPKSGLALNYGLTVLNTPGTVDRGYTGEIKVILFNINNFPMTINKGIKIAQAVLSPVVCGKYVELINTDLIEKSERGENGFGSTGINK